MASADPVDFEEMAAEQNCCPETQHLLGSTSLKLAFCQTGAQRLAGDISTGTFRPIVPLKFRKYIFANFLNVAHPGRLASCRIISSRFVWCGLSSNVTAWARGCLACQWGTQPIPIPQRRFSHLHVDLVGPLQYSNNFNYIFTIIDRTSKWMEAIPLPDTSAAACAKALTFTWISVLAFPKRSLPIEARNLLQTSGLNCARTNNCLPPRVEWCSRKTAPPPQGRPSRTCRRGNLVRKVTFCAPRTPSTAEGRHSSFPG
jgi:hypothetical protein